MTIGIDASRAFVDRPTGTERYSREILEALLRIDKENTYVLYTRPGVHLAGPTAAHPRPMSSLALALPPRLAMGTRRGPLLAVPAADVSFREILFPFLWTQAGLALQTWVWPPDVLFIPAHTLPVLRRPGVKIVVTIHDLGAEWLPGHHQFPQKVYLTWSTEYALKHADAIITVSEATKNDAVRRFQTDPKKIHVVHEGVDQEVFFPRSEAEVKRPYFLFVGTIQPRKNLVRLIEAFARFLKVSPASAHDLLLIGKPGWLHQEIYAAPRRFGVADRVRFLENVPSEDLPAFYSGATALLFPSLWEGFGLPILEAMACGCPVVTSNVSSMPEVGGDSVLYVDPYSIEDIKQKIQLLANSESKCQELKKKGLERAKKFTWEASARKTLVVFSHLFN